MIKFTKYKERKGYHWREYVAGSSLYKQHVDKIKGWVKERNILDIGAGDGLITFLLRAKGIDNERSGVKIAQAIGVDVILGDAYQLPFKKDEFEAAGMFDVIEHLEFPDKALLEASRVAKVLYVTTPERGMVNEPLHIKEFTKQELRDFLLKNNWKPEDIEVNKELKCMYCKAYRIK